MKRLTLNLLALAIICVVAVSCAKTPTPEVEEVATEKVDTGEVATEKVDTGEVATEKVDAGEVGKPSDKLIIKVAGGTFGDALRTALFDPFTEETGIKIIVDEGYATDALIKAMVEAGTIEWDIALKDDFDSAIALQEGWLDPIDYSMYDSGMLAGYDETLRHDYSLGWYCSGMNLVYNSNVFTEDNHPNSWADFWDVERFPGTRSLQAPDYSQTCMAVALLADGVPKDEVFPIDFDRAFSKLDEIKPDITKWWSSGQECADLLANEEVVMGSCWDGRAAVPISEGAPLVIVRNDQVGGCGGWVLLTNAPHSDDARYAFLNYVIRPENNAEMAKLFPYGYEQSKMFDLLDDEIAKGLFSYPAYSEFTLIDDATFWSQPYKDTGKTNIEYLWEYAPVWLVED